MKSEIKPGFPRRIYLAGPFFSEIEIKNIEYAETVLAGRGFSFFSPMRHSAAAEKGTSEWARQTFEMDREQIDRSDVVVALYYGANSDTGTAWECGYAAGIGIPVVLVHVDENASSNLMMHCGCTTNISLKALRDYDFSLLPVYEFYGEMF